MARTNVKGTQVFDGSVSRVDLNTTTPGNAVITKLIANNGVAITNYSGADSGTGDVTIAADLSFLDTKYPSILASRTQNHVLAAPTSGNGAAVFRALIAGDIPAIAISGVTALQAALDAKLSGTGTTNYISKYTGSATMGISSIFDNAQGVGIGSTAPGINTLKVSKDISTSGLGGGVAIGIRSDGLVASDVTATAYYFRSDASTAGAVTNVIHYSANQSTFDGTVGWQTGFYVDGLSDATANIGFRGNIASGATNWNLYMSGTANNYLNGNLGLGATSPTTRLSLGTFWNSSAETVGINLYEGSVSGGLPAYGIGFGPAGTEGYVTYRSGTGNSTAFGHKFFVNNVEVMRVRGDGNFGIGTSTPIYKLDVAGNARLTSNLIITGSIANGTAVAYFDNNNTTTDQSFGLLVDAGTSVTDYVLKLRNASGTEMLQVNGVGTLNIGAAGTLSTSSTLTLAKPLNSSTSFGIYNYGLVTTSNTGTAFYYRSVGSTQAAGSAYTIAGIAHYSATQSPLGTNSTVTNQYGFLVDNTLVGATNNYAFYGSLPSGDWNLYMSGAGSNFLNGRLGIGSNVLVDRNIQLVLPITGATTAYGMLSNGQVQSGVTANAYQFFSQANTAADVTLGTFSHYVALQGTIGGSVTTQNGFHVPALTGATNNIAFRGSIAYAAGAWNLYMDGSANNFLGGNLGIGTTALTGISLRISKNLVSNSGVAFGLLNDGQIQSDAISYVSFFQSNPSTQATDFTLPNLYHFIANQGSFGVGSLVNNQFGFYVNNNLTGADGNYGFFGNIGSGFGRWNFYAAGTASNYFSGQTLIGTTTSNAKLTVADSAAPIIAINRAGVGYGIIGISGGTNGSAGDMYFDMGQASAGYFFRTRNASNTIVNAIGIDRNGNVGIGTFAPVAKLDVGGDIALTGTTGTNNIIMKNGNIGSFIHIDFPDVTTNSANFRLFRQTNTTSTRVFTIFKGDGTANAQHQLNADGNSYLNALNGNVGIGTTTPSVKLHAYTGGLTGSAPIIDIEANGTGGRPYLRFKAESAIYGYYGYGGSGNHMHLLNYQNANLYLGTNNAFYMTMIADGKIGFGGSFTPSTDVHINGTGVKQLRLQSTDTAAILSIYGATYGQLVSQNDLYLTAGGAAGRVIFQSNAVTRGLITATGDMILSNSILTPASKLDVDGTITLRSGSIVTNSITGGLSVNGTARSMLISYNSNVATEGILFRNTNAAPNLDLMFLKGDGNVGINTVTPAYKLDVVGDINTTTHYKIGGVRIGEWGQFQGHTQYTSFAAINNWGTSFINGSAVDMPSTATQWHVMKLGIGSEYSEQATYLAFGRPFSTYFDGKIYVRGMYGGIDSGWLGVGGDIKTYNIDRGEYYAQYKGMMIEEVSGDQGVFIGKDTINGGILFEMNVVSIDSPTNTIYQNWMSPEDGRLYYISPGTPSQKKKYLVEGDVISTGGTTYSGVSPINISVGGAISIDTASSSTMGVLSPSDWTLFSNKFSLPSGGTNGQALVKSGSTAVWATISSGGTYTGIGPITVSGTDISIANASGSQTGALTSTDWTTFNNKFSLPSGGTNGQVLVKSGSTAVWATASSGGTYTGDAPITISGANISIATASASQTGALTSTDWTTFNNKFTLPTGGSNGNVLVKSGSNAIWQGDFIKDGGSVSNALYFGGNLVINNSSGISFDSQLPINSNASARIFFSGTDFNISTSTGGYGNKILISAEGITSVRGLGNKTGIDLPAVTVELEIGGPSMKNLLLLNGTRVNFFRNSTPANNAKFVLQYDSLSQVYNLMPA
jgi:hypothetical protein